MKQWVVMFLLIPAVTQAQGIIRVNPEPAGQAGTLVFQSTAFAAFDAAPMEDTPPVKGAPFSAEAVTEFVQVLGDGNRIERSFRASIARDGVGRTRREEQIALLGPLAVGGDPPKLVTIADPVSGDRFTLDEQRKVAMRNRVNVNVAFAKLRADHGSMVSELTYGPGERLRMVKPLPNQAIGVAGAFFEAAAPASDVVVEQLGSRTIEGVEAEGTRSTMTIPAGAMGNQLPINVVSERWFSKELQVPVLITRRDPRAGDTEYRLTNLVRAEPPQDLFVVPREYDVQDSRDFVMETQKIERRRR